MDDIKAINTLKNRHHFGTYIPRSIVEALNYRNGHDIRIITEFRKVLNYLRYILNSKGEGKLTSSELRFVEDFKEYEL